MADLGGKLRTIPLRLCIIDGIVTEVLEGDWATKRGVVVGMNSAAKEPLCRIVAPVWGSKGTQPPHVPSNATRGRRPTIRALGTDHPRQRLMSGWSEAVALCVLGPSAPSRAAVDLSVPDGGLWKAG